MRTSIETVTPESAAHILESRCAANRPRNARHVATLAEDMASCAWRTNGEAIIFDSDGMLIDGQHRLAACVKAGVPFTTLVVRDVDHEAFSTIDLGKKRTVSDVLAMTGHQNSSVIGAALGLVTRYDQSNLLNRNRAARLDPLAALATYPDMIDSVPYGERAHSVVAKSVGCAAHFLFARVDRDDAAKFVTDVATGINLQDKDPALLVRGVFVANSRRRGKLRAEELLAYFIKGWNLHREGRCISRLTVTLYGDHAEPYPTVSTSEARLRKIKK